MIDITELSEQDLKQKIDNIKAEREKTAEALKRYREELERRENQKWLPIREDIPFSVTYDHPCFDELYVEMKADACFKNHACFEKYVEFLREVHKALFSNAKGEPIDIKVLCPLFRKGWVAMDENKEWCWYALQPKAKEKYFEAEIGNWSTFRSFNIKPAEDWRNSLMECGL